MELLVAAASAPLPTVPQLLGFSKPKPKPSRPSLLHCSRFGFRNSGESNGISRASVPIELRSSDDVESDQNYSGKTDNEKEVKHNDIWKLFKEAQENILFLNKQRVLAMEELDQVKNEKNSLIDRVKQWEVEKPANIRRDKLSVSSELLLRVDSLVLTGLIGSTEASELRRIIMDFRGNSDDFYEIISKNDAELLSELRYFSNKSKRNSFHVIHICTEMFPVVSVGSLASYITGLSCALQRKGNLVELDEVQGLRKVEAEFYSYFNGQLHGNRIWTGIVCGIGVTFLEPVYYSSLFSHNQVYGLPNDFERFAYFSRASLDYLVKSGKRPDVLHIHNWQTSIVGPLFWDIFVNQGFECTRILLTCQDFDSQYLEQPEKLALCGLDPSRLHRTDRLQDNKKAHLVNIVKGGVVYSNKVIIMSSSQPKSQIINGLGHGLEPTLAIHKEKLMVAPHGFDKSTWDPSSDAFLPQRYSADDMTGKSECKFTLQRELGLPEGSSTILVGCICSDISDADLEKLKTLVWMASRKGVQFVFMVSSGSPGVQMGLEVFQQEVKEDENVRFINEYDEELSHLIISGSDIMLCPSFDDPLLQVPLKALRYGAAPVPLHFTDSRYRPFGDHDGEITKFSQYINNTFGNMSLSHAIDEIKNNLSQWNRKIKDAMARDFSWDSECYDVHVAAYNGIKRL